MGYIPGSLTVGVWMGNNNQEPMSNRLGQGLFSADGPLYLWHDFMDARSTSHGTGTATRRCPTPTSRARRAWSWPVCRFSGMSRHGGCGRRSRPVPRRDRPAVDNVHHTDQWHPDGCFDIVQYVQQAGPPGPVGVGRRRLGGQVQQRAPGHVGQPYAVSPLYGTSGFGGPICGELQATPRHRAQPASHPRNCRLPPPPLCPTPSPEAGGPGGRRAARSTPVCWCPFFAVPLVAGGASYLLRLARRRH